jgi:lysylphosphatidylglycerol synthetase-like protein (DUF2156 family)
MSEQQSEESQGPQEPHGHQIQYVPQAETNGLAVASLVCGILGVVLPFIPLIPSVLAVVFARRSKRQIASSDGLQTGRGLAVAGQVLGWVGIALTLLGILGLIALFAVADVSNVEFSPVQDTLG